MKKQSEDELAFETLKIGGDAKPFLVLQRARVPGGWLMASYLLATLSFKTASVTFYPDVDHAWDGTSLPAGPVEAEEVQESPGLYPGRRSK